MGRAAPAGASHNRQGKQRLRVRETRSPLELPESPTRSPRSTPALQQFPGTFDGLSSVVHDQEADGNCLECQEQCFTPRAVESRVGREKAGLERGGESLHSHPPGLCSPPHTHLPQAWLTDYTSARAVALTRVVGALGLEKSSAGKGTCLSSSPGIHTGRREPAPTSCL